MRLESRRLATRSADTACVRLYTHVLSFHSEAFLIQFSSYSGSGMTPAWNRSVMRSPGTWADIVRLRAAEEAVHSEPLRSSITPGIRGSSRVRG